MIQTCRLLLSTTRQPSELGGSGAGFRVQGSGFRVQESEFRVQGSGFRVECSVFRVQGSGFRVQGSGLTGSGLRVSGQARTQHQTRYECPPAEHRSFGLSGDTTPCRMTGVSLQSHVHYKQKGGLGFWGRHLHSIKLVASARPLGVHNRLSVAVREQPAQPPVLGPPHPSADQTRFSVSAANVLAPPTGTEHAENYSVQAGHLSPVDPSFRALSGCLKLKVRYHKFNEISSPSQASSKRSSRCSQEEEDSSSSSSSSLPSSL